MSRAGGYVVTLDGERIGHIVYSGTSDVLGPNIAESDAAAWEYDDGRASRIDGKNAWDAAGACEHEQEEGYAYTSYGGGSYWPVKFCRRCMVVHGPLMPYVILEGSDAPGDWMGVWPKDGEPPIEGSVSQRELPPGDA